MPIQHFPPPPGVKSPPLSFAAGVGDLLFISGIPGFDANGALPDGFEAQFANVVTNIKRVLDEAGATFRDVGKFNVLLTRASAVAGGAEVGGAALPRSEDVDRDGGRGVGKAWCGLGASRYPPRHLIRERWV